MRTKNLKELRNELKQMPKNQLINIILNIMVKMDKLENENKHINPGI